MNNWLQRLVFPALCLLLGCQQKMALQPSLRVDEASPLFPNDAGNRPLPPGTVPRGHLRTDWRLFTGRRPGSVADRTAPVLAIGAGGFNVVPSVAVAMSPADLVDQFPFPVTREVIEHGRDRYMIYCVVCHDPAGTGQGPIVQRGYTPPPSYHIDRLRHAPVGHLFDVITNGYGSMPEYKQQVPPLDRWAIVAYIRAMQLSRHFPESQLTAEMRQEWQAQKAGSRAGGTP